MTAHTRTAAHGKPCALFRTRHTFLPCTPILRAERSAAQPRGANHPGAPGRTQPADRPTARQMEDGSMHRQGCLELRYGKTGWQLPPLSGTGRQAGPQEWTADRPTTRPGCERVRTGSRRSTGPTLPRDTDPGSCRPSRAARRRACQILTGASTGVKPAKRRRSSASMATLVIWSELCVSPLAYGRGACCPGSRLLLPSCWRSLQHGGGRGTARPGLVARELPHRQTLAAAAAEAVRTETVREPLPSPCPSASWTGAMCASSSVPSAP